MHSSGGRSRTKEHLSNHPNVLWALRRHLLVGKAGRRKQSSFLRQNSTFCSLACVLRTVHPVPSYYTDCRHPPTELLLPLLGPEHVEWILSLSQLSRCPSRREYQHLTKWGLALCSNYGMTTGTVSCPQIISLHYSLKNSIQHFIPWNLGLC